jgi:molybdopterin converting factor small subunit
MTIRVQFHSFFKELAGCSSVEETVEPGTTVDHLLTRLYGRFPKLSAMRNSTLIAVGLDYQGRSHVLKPGDEVSLFPPVQGG